MLERGTLEGTERAKCASFVFSAEPCSLQAYIFDPDSKNPSFFQAAGNYIHDHPVSFGLQVSGGVVLIASIAAVPVLGAVGFAATGPVAGSTAAAWQASIGLVEAGSVFAWCQSAAMGGAALGGVFASGAAGAGVAGLATVPVLPRTKEKFRNMFQRG